MNIADAHILAEDLMKTHGLYDKGWRFGFFRSKKAFGRCLYRERKILLSSEFAMINDERHIRDTILHEIAHALVGSSHGHDEVWQDKARQIGCDGKRFFDAGAVREPRKPYVGICPNCGKIIERYRRMRIACKDCCNAFNGGRYSKDFLFVWKTRGSAEQETRDLSSKDTHPLTLT